MKSSLQYVPPILRGSNFKIKKWILNNAFLIILSLCIISRLPQLLSPNLFLDADECVVGLMAKHFLEGKDIPYFFYGQSYGFSLIEVLIISLLYTVFGISDIAIKIAMLFLWIFGIVFYYKTLKLVELPKNDWISFLAIILFIFSPAWATWSMKARGGYLTSFALSSFVMYMLFHKNLNKSSYCLFLVGFLSVVIYQSQPLWLAGLIPVLGYRLYLLKQKRSLMLVCTGMATSMLLFYFLKADISNFWSPKILSLPLFTFASILTIPNQIYWNLSGSYNFNYFVQPIIVTKVLAFISTLFIFAGLGLAFIYFIKGKKINNLFYVFSISVLCTISFTLILDNPSPRYLLPLFGYAFLMFFTLIMDSKKMVVTNTILFFIISLGVISLYSFKDFKVEIADKQGLLTLVNELESRNIHHIYSKSGSLQWQIMFYSNEQIIARYFGTTDRYPEYINLVDNALNSSESEVAMVGPINLIDKSMSSDHIILVENLYFIYLNPDEIVLMDNGFKFK